MIGPYLVNSVTLKQFKGSDVHGTPSTRTSVTVKSRIDYKNRKVENEAGEVVVSKAKVYMRPRTITRTDFSTRASNTIAYEDLITFDGIDHAIILIAKIQDFSVKFLEVYIA